VAHAQIHRIVEQRLIVGADVEHNRQGQRGWDAGAGRVQAQFAGRNAHPADALIAEAENPFAVGDDDHGRGSGVVPEDAIDLVALLVGDEQPARPTKDVRELLTRLADHGGVDDRHQLVDVLVQQPVEQRLVAVVQGGEIDVPFERCVLALIALIDPIQLLGHGADLRRQQPVQTQRVAFVDRKRRAFVGERIRQQCGAAPMDGNRAGVRSHRGLLRMVSIPLPGARC
jgi:hypothetical protein